jgi:hypothetical protein
VPPGYGHAKQECDKQARQRSFAGNGADDGERLAGPPRGRDRGAQPIDRGLECGRGLRDGARHIGRGIDGAFGHAGLGCFDIHDLMLTPGCLETRQRPGRPRDETTGLRYRQLTFAIRD